MLDFIGSNKATSTDALQAIADKMTPPENLVRIVIVSDNEQLALKMSSLLRRIYPDAQDIHITDNQQEASEFVREEDFV